jgi:O-acetylhomoserine/O-acetylserine sulfhydrylase-like pyridoxal-dependent enzyme
LAGENEKLANALFIADKALAIGEIIVNTQREIAGIFASYSTIPGGQAIAIPLVTAAKIRAATSIASIVASSLTKFKGGGGGSIGGASVGGGSIAGAGATAPSLGAITNTSTLIGQEPTQVFVTETDITNVQNQVAVIETQATIK